MKKATFLLFLFCTTVFSQTKTSGVFSLNSEMTAQFTLNSEISKVTLVLTGPSSKWTSVNIGTSTSTTTGDVFVYTGLVSDNAPTNPSFEPSQEWKMVSNEIVLNIRSVTLERTLTNTDLNDFQLAFDNTNSIDLVWSRSGVVASTTTANRGSRFVNLTTTLGIDDVFKNEEIVIYPNPTSEELFVKTAAYLSKINIFNPSGSLLETINIKDNLNEIKVNVSHLPKALYFFEFQNDSKRSSKKVIVE